MKNESKKYLEFDGGRIEDRRTSDVGKEIATTVLRVDDIDPRTGETIKSGRVFYKWNPGDGTNEDILKCAAVERGMRLAFEQDVRNFRVEYLTDNQLRNEKDHTLG